MQDFGHSTFLCFACFLNSMLNREHEGIHGLFFHWCRILSTNRMSAFFILAPSLSLTLAHVNVSMPAHLSCRYSTPTFAGAIRNFRLDDLPLRQRAHDHRCRNLAGPSCSSPNAKACLGGKLANDGTWPVCATQTWPDKLDTNPCVIWQYRAGDMVERRT